MAEHQPAFGHHQATAGLRRGAAEARGFWHRPEWMNPIADALLLGASIALGYAGMKVALAMPLFGFREVVVLTPLSQVTKAQLEYAARSGLRGNFFTVRLDEAQAAFEKLPWVRRAEVRRVWPGMLEVRLEEHEAVAYWRGSDGNDTRLVNKQGEVFTAASNTMMPQFSGPEGRAAEVLEHYRTFSQRLAPLQVRLSAISLSGREAWQLKLSDGMVIDLGREQSGASLVERLSRFVDAWPVAKSRLPAPVMVADLRYPSGFTVRSPAESSSGKGKQ